MDSAGKKWPKGDSKSLKTNKKAVDNSLQLDPDNSGKKRGERRQSVESAQRSPQRVTRSRSRSANADRVRRNEDTQGEEADNEEEINPDEELQKLSRTHDGVELDINASEDDFESDQEDPESEDDQDHQRSDRSSRSRFTSESRSRSHESSVSEEEAAKKYYMKERLSSDQVAQKLIQELVKDKLKLDKPKPKRGKGKVKITTPITGASRRNSNMVKSPSDIMIYSPALAKIDNHDNCANKVIDKISDFVENIRLNTNSSRHSKTPTPSKRPIPNESEGEWSESDESTDDHKVEFSPSGCDCGRSRERRCRDTRLPSHGRNRHGDRHHDSGRRSRTRSRSHRSRDIRRRERLHS